MEAKNITTNQARLTWKDSSVVTAFRVQLQRCKTQPNTNDNCTVTKKARWATKQTKTYKGISAQKSRTVKRKLAKNLLDDRWYRYRVRAVGANGVGPWSKWKQFQTQAEEMVVTSAAVEDGLLLDDYKCETKVDDVENSIPLAWSNVPDGAQSLAVTIHHYPNEGDTVNVNSYLALWGIDPSVTEIGYGEADDGEWYIGSNKDGTAISYTSPCSHSAGSHEYIITLYALSATPPSLPTEDSLEVDYDVLVDSLDEVTVIDTATLVFDSVTE